MLNTVESLLVVKGILELERNKPSGKRSAAIAEAAKHTSNVLLARLRKEQCNLAKINLLFAKPRQEQCNIAKIKV